MNFAFTIVAGVSVLLCTAALFAGVEIPVSILGFAVFGIIAAAAYSVIYLSKVKMNYESQREIKEADASVDPREAIEKLKSAAYKVWYDPKKFWPILDKLQDAYNRAGIDFDTMEIGNKFMASTSLLEPETYIEEEYQEFIQYRNSLP